MKLILAFVICLHIFFYVNGQITFERYDSVEVGGGQFCCPTSYYIIQTHDSGYLSAGIILDGANVNYYWEKLDSSGHLEWWKVFGYANGKVDLHSVNNTSDHGFIICGNPRNSPFPIGVLKTDSNGVSEWVKFIANGNGDLYAYCAKQTMDGGYIIAGSKNSPGALDAELIKLSSNGTFAWAKAYGAILAQEIFYDIVETDDSGFVAVGSTDPTGNLHQLFIVRTNSLGDTIWARIYQDGFNFTEGISVSKTFDNGFVITGYPKNQGNPGYGSILFKLDAQGELLWEKRFGASDSLFINSVKQTSDSGFILSGIKNKILKRSGCLIKTNSQGDTLWTKLKDAGSYVCPTYDEGFAITGGSSAMVIKTDKFGNTFCNSLPSGFEITQSSLSLVSDTVQVYPDIFTTIPLVYGNIGPHIINRILCDSLTLYVLNPDKPIIELFPNPSDKILKINSNSGITNIEIYNPLGTLVKKSTAHGMKEFEINISELASSMYFIKLYCKEGSSTLKFLKTEYLN